ncbi:Lipid A export ATP-binding/permease protein msbA [Actinoplanes sp. SE50]|uniref:CpaF family protein n=1 Tax=unclassified Actinoplanes TaxID=2626549 RepID=UPI00023ED677|nr:MULTISPECIES: ATPase, T2SS/T4P/T4SS family [unclassified Actinoplanes]AEV86780.1 Lipid A export ATP-binding/permease protein msbA [Actinoplanes sp. SE50/110]ATO85177.1 Lipid A export ATP-binding/permease protein msbA [Actinoplanes sp. SE50]SLM02587.1 hypothetical protein ACSP50_5869 [Actinoplanes sp. SE50/110]
MPDRPPLNLYRPVEPRRPSPRPGAGAPAAPARTLPSLPSIVTQLPPPPPLPAQGRRRPPVELDYEVVLALHSLVSDRVSDNLRGRQVGPDSQRQLTIETTREVVREHIDNRIQAGDQIPLGYEDALTDAVAAQLLGLGRLQPLLDDPQVKNIHVSGHDRVRVEYADGRVDEQTFTAAGSDAELLELLQRRAARDGLSERSLSTSQPILHLRLADGSRMVAAIAVTPRPVVVIRRHRITKVTLDDMVKLGSITPLLADFLKAIVAGKVNTIVAGLAGSGKTTLLRALASEIDREEWFAVMETERELALDPQRHPWAVEFEERQGHGERDAQGRPEGELRLVDLFPAMLRMNMQRVVVGEVRAAEIVSMLDAGATTQGTLSTIHARSADAALTRLAELLLRYGATPTPTGAYMQITGAIDLLIFQRVDKRPGQPDRHYVSDVIELNGLADNGLSVARSHLFRAQEPGGLAMPTGVRPNDHILQALSYGGFDVQRLFPETAAAAGTPWGR